MARIFPNPISPNTKSHAERELYGILKDQLDDSFVVIHNVAWLDKRKFRNAHRQHCQVSDIIWTAIHVDFKSDVLQVGPYSSEEAAVNVFEALRIGARMVLDMGENEIAGIVLPDETGTYWAVLYDPMPGGSGFLPEILNYWEPVCDRAGSVLDACNCEKAFYKCMRHFRNQQFHDLYDRHLTGDLLSEIGSSPVQEHEIPAIVDHTDPETSLTDELDSPAEEDFIAILELKSCQKPDEAQYRIDLGNGEVTLADYT